MKKTYETLSVTDEEGVRTIVLSRPEVLNALSPKLLEEFGNALSEASSNEQVKVVVITGAGKAFSSGGDVKLDVSMVSKMAPFEFRSYVHTGLVKQIVEMEKPVIAAINGMAAGGGLDIALSCDIRFASDKARFSEIFVRVGIVPDLGGVYFLPRLVGLGRAKLLAFTGDIIDAREAERIGLVDKLFPHDELMAAANQLALRLANGPTRAIAMIKLAMNRALNMDLDTAIDYTTNLNYLLVHTEDHREAFTAFLEKRKPVFKGR